MERAEKNEMGLASRKSLKKMIEGTLEETEEQSMVRSVDEVDQTGKYPTDEKTAAEIQIELPELGRQNS